MGKIAIDVNNVKKVYKLYDKPGFKIKDNVNVKKEFINYDTLYNY